jgi:hypothetical protein
MAIEQPEYAVERSAGGVEFRRYESYQVAECDLREVNDISQASSAGFRYLFNYISGDNQPGQKVSMTSPVQQMPSENGWRVSFVVPREFYKTGAPAPSNAKVSIREVPAGLVAALRYKGFWGTDTFNQHKAQLLKKLAEQGVQIEGDVFSALYNPPFTPPFLRRNEVLVRVKEAAS